jgi:hypothetical protein
VPPLVAAPIAWAAGASWEQCLFLVPFAGLAAVARQRQFRFDRESMTLTARADPGGIGVTSGLTPAEDRELAEEWSIAGPWSRLRSDDVYRSALGRCTLPQLALLYQKWSLRRTIAMVTMMASPVVGVAVVIGGNVGRDGLPPTFALVMNVFIALTFLGHAAWSLAKRRLRLLSAEFAARGLAAGDSW